MDERLRFVARILEGEKMAVACRQFGISRKTGYKMLSRKKGYATTLVDLHRNKVFCNDPANNCTWYFEPKTGDNHDARTRDQKMDSQT